MKTVSVQISALTMTVSRFFFFSSFPSIFSLCVVSATIFSLALACEMNTNNKARYDNFRLVRVSLESEDHVKLFQELEDESDSFVFYGHALAAPQQVTILVAAHK